MAALSNILAPMACQNCEPRTLNQGLGCVVLKGRLAREPTLGAGMHAATPPTPLYGWQAFRRK
jgi:hypothetical protein